MVSPSPGPSSTPIPPTPVPSYRPGSTIYPPTQPAPLFLDEDDFDEAGRYIDSALLSVSDPDNRLRLTRSATETIHEAISEDDRRRRAKKKRLGQSRRFQRRSRPATASSSILTPGTPSRKPSSFVEPKLPPLPIAPELDEPSDEHTQNLKELEDSPAADLHRKNASATTRPGLETARRSVFVNLVLPTGQLDRNGDPLAKYVRNKVRTTKYTIVSFLPKVCHSLSQALMHHCLKARYRIWHYSRRSIYRMLSNHMRAYPNLLSLGIF